MSPVGSAAAQSVGAAVGHGASIEGGEVCPWTPHPARRPRVLTLTVALTQSFRTQEGLCLAWAQEPWEACPRLEFDLLIELPGQWLGWQLLTVRASTEGHPASCSRGSASLARWQERA